MGLTGRLFWVSSYGKKQWRRLFWKVRAAVKKAGNGRGRKGGSKQHLKFQYDPSSYALNFDDGSKGIWDEATNVTNESNINGFQQVKFQLLHSIPNSNTTTWIYVFWVKI